MKNRILSSLIALSSLAPVVDAAAVRLVRATAGSKGAVHGSRYILEDPRTTFSAEADRQVIAHFEWEGSPGAHECVVTWKDPTGAVVLVAPYTQRATSPRFSVYWTLTLPVPPRVGLWAAEAQVDGEPAGTLTFQIQPGTPASSPTAGSTRRVLAPEEMYARANSATLAIQALDAGGRTMHRASGFPFGEGRVLTAFQAVEGASRLRVTGASGGTPIESDRLLGWNRKQDWAVIAAPAVTRVPMGIDRSRSWKVGDRCSFLEVGADGSRAITETTIVGAQDFPGRGARILIASAFGALSVGAPLMDEYGDAIGVLGGTLAPGMGLPAHGAFLSYGPAPMAQTMAVPTVGVSPELAGPGETLAALGARGVFPPPLVGPRSVLTGTIARAVERQNDVPIAVDEKSEFRRSEKEAVAFLTFDPQEKRGGMAAFRIYDEDNRVVMEGKPSKFSLRPRKYQVTTWRFPVANLKPGAYRIDFVIDTDPIWRSTFRVTE
jgi:hypothetical protein